MYPNIDECFMCTNDYNCSIINDKIITQVEYLLPEITIIKRDIPLRICPSCELSLESFRKFKDVSVKNNLLLEARLIEAQTIRNNVAQSNDSAIVKDKCARLKTKVRKLQNTLLQERIIKKPRYVEIREAKTNSTPNTEFQSNNTELMDDSTLDISAKYVEKNSIKEESCEDTPYDRESYNNLVQNTKKECKSGNGTHLYPRAKPMILHNKEKTKSDMTNMNYFNWRLKDHLPSHQPLRTQKCIAHGCNNVNKENPELGFFCFPANQTASEVWAKTLNIAKLVHDTPLTTRRHFRVCAMHFEDKAFQTPLRKKLIRGAVPKMIRNNEGSQKKYCTQHDLKVSILGSQASKARLRLALEYACSPSKVSLSGLVTIVGKNMFPVSAMEDLGILEYLEGRNVLLTGATGFLGKVLLEKLLRSCPAIGTIYILVRPKRGKMPNERLRQILQNSLYDRLKKEQPNLNMEQKIIALIGDCGELNLGLSTEDRRLVTENVHLIFHSAATVRFDEQLHRAVLLNLRGTREMCHLALECNKIEAFIYISTAFANSNRDEAHEVLYSAAADWRQVIDVAERFNPETLSALTAKFLDDMPNTYCFTKNLAEHAVNDLLKGKVPTKIFRPSIVISTLKEEPVCGWVDNFNGPVALLLAFGTGIMRAIYINEHNRPDYIPVDVCVKAMVVAAWQVAVRQERVVEVIQCTSYQAEWLRPSNRDLKDQVKWFKEYPTNQTVWYPSPHLCTNRIAAYIRMMLYMVLPSALMDTGLLLTGNEPRLLKIQKKIFVAQQSMKHFINNEWNYSNSALLDLLKCIPDKDRLAWDYDFSTGDRDIYTERGAIGVRRYLLHESDDTLPQARKRLRIIYWLYIGWHFVFYIGLLFVLWTVLPPAITRVLV